MTIEAFGEERFPLRVGFGASGGPERHVEIVRLSTGHEHRNLRHRHSFRRYDAGAGIRSLSDLGVLLDFFEARRGKLTGFRFRDPLEDRSCAPGREPEAFDQAIGEGDGTRREFQLVKVYGTGATAYRREIRKPVPGSVQIAVNGAEMGEGVGIDPLTGLVSFEAAPAAGALVSAGYRFDVPVRFDLDHLSISVSAFRAGEVPSVPLLELVP